MTGGLAPRRKGATYERDVVAWLRANGYPNAERRIAGMSDDRGDISGVPNCVIECKNQRALDLGSWFRQMELEQFQSESDLGALFIKRRGVTDVGHHYVCMSGYSWLDLMSWFNPYGEQGS